MNARCVNTGRVAPAIARNYISAGAGRARAVCACCGRQSRPVKADSDGEPDLWSMARGWSSAPFPHDCKHADGSIGSTYTCPDCNRQLHKGETLQLRAYMGGIAKVREVA